LSDWRLVRFELGYDLIHLERVAADCMSCVAPFTLILSGKKKEKKKKKGLFIPL
jgi:hypothetical protein